ncbi:hypothetical protein EIN_085720 [Entamoeba invadens IP1]|uniref:hypothetical protein n=1 Tax=Entamoeba invadens IP1 TaxID=370355 RepID=UPI0002C3CEEB|nr:hypothetical protein EIN_085720 [Entamoeba invadens IP1]ELP85330.1 hypothetical protein EIN_085720 [Entamoeba invadens IP1]|eukprot:XP_004184676.1 hypothetical protein EIN_085720 [Entamoeba invadens IP1]
MSQPNLTCCYCHSVEGVLECAQCGKRICNGALSNSSKCQLLVHIIKRQHFSIKCNGLVLACTECGDTNVFNLFFETDTPIFYCIKCLKKKPDDFRKACQYNLVNDGAIDLSNMQFPHSPGVCSLDEVYKEEGIQDETFDLIGVHTTNRYNNTNIYAKIYIKLLEFEEENKGWEDSTVQKSNIKFVPNDTGTKVYISKQLLCFINARPADMIILVGGGDKSPIKTETREEIEHNIKGYFPRADFVVFGHIKTINKTSVLELDPMLFGGSDLSSLMNTSSEFMNYSKVFRVYCYKAKNSFLNSKKVMSQFGNSQLTDYKKAILGIQQFTNTNTFTLNDINTDFSGRTLDLNDSQKNAVLQGLNCNCSLIVGPPGTGKSTVAVALVQNLMVYKQHFVDGIDIQQKILVSGPSNNAVNALCEKLIENDIECVRIVVDNKYTNMSTKVFHKTLMYKVYTFLLKTFQEVDDVNKINVRKFLDVFERKVQQFLTDSDKDKLASLELIYNTTPEIKRDFKTFNDFLQTQDDALWNKVSGGADFNDDQIIRKIMKNYQDVILNDCEVVCATLSKQISGVKFWCTIGDEASQALEPETLKAINEVKKVVLIGDFNQLPPTVVTTKAKQGGLDLSMFERLIQNKVFTTLLNVQYRMHPAISSFPSKNFYKGNLHDGVTEQQRSDPRLDHFFPVEHWPVVFIHHEGKESVGENGASYYNVNEVGIVTAVIGELKNRGFQDRELGIISTYNSQIQLISENIEKQGNIQTSSVDSFQGSEKEIIVLSCVRSNERLGIGFVSDHRRMNVALTRARKGLVVVGNMRTLSTDQNWRKLILTYGEKQCVVSLQTFPFKFTKIPIQVSQTIKTEAIHQVLYSIDNNLAFNKQERELQQTQDTPFNIPESLLKNIPKTVFIPELHSEQTQLNVSQQTYQKLIKTPYPKAVDIPQPSPIIKQTRNVVQTQLVPIDNYIEGCDEMIQFEGHTLKLQIGKGAPESFDLNYEIDGPSEIINLQLTVKCDGNGIYTRRGGDVYRQLLFLDYLNGVSIDFQQHVFNGTDNVLLGFEIQSADIRYDGFGLPVQTPNGYQNGALVFCVRLVTDQKDLSPDDIELNQLAYNIKFREFH